MTIKSPPPHVAFCMILLAAVVAVGLSCSSEPQSIQLRMKYGSPGSSTSYKFTASEVGKVYGDSGLIRDFDIKIEGDIAYNTKDTLPGGGAIILEKNRWSWDEPADDSGQVKRVTREYAYNIRMLANHRSNPRTTYGISPSRPIQSFPIRKSPPVTIGCRPYRSKSSAGPSIRQK
jgi:hypothetical protein